MSSESILPSASAQPISTDVIDFVIDQPTKREPKKETGLVFTAQPDGRVVANKSVYEIIMDKQKRMERGT